MTTYEVGNFYAPSAPAAPQKTSTFAQQADAVRGLAKQYKSVIELGAFLDALGGLENHEAELKTQIEKLKDEKTAATEATFKAQDALLVVQAGAKAVTAAADDRATDLVQAAAEHAERILAEADASNAATQAAAQAVLEGIEADLAEAKTALQDVRSDVEELVAKRDELQAQLDALKARFA